MFGPMMYWLALSDDPQSCEICYIVPVAPTHTLRELVGLTIVCAVVTYCCCC